MKLSILIPVYNEEETIQEILKKIDEVDLTSQKVEKEIIIVNDGSTDSTNKKIEDLQKSIPRLDIKVIYQENQGKGAAIRKAIAHATGDIMIVQDADLEYDPQDYGILIEPIIQKEVKVVYGSRKLKKDNEGYSSLSFFIGGYILTVAANLLYGSKLTDEPTCYKVFDAETLRSIKLRCKRFEFCPEVTAKVLNKGIEIKEVPISYYPRSKSEGKKINWRDGFEGMWTLIKYKVRKDL
ncbi:MAG: glycosyl transferase [Nanoarchaeota archaeon]|nr:glycosyl transferase [Nanoarchaeota archaeon]